MFSLGLFEEWASDGIPIVLALWMAGVVLRCDFENGGIAADVTGGDDVVLRSGAGSQMDPKSGLFA